MIAPITTTEATAMIAPSSLSVLPVCAMFESRYRARHPGGTDKLDGAIIAVASVVVIGAIMSILHG